MSDDLVNLLQEAKTLLETAPISAGNTLTNRFWREWVEKRKALLPRIELALARQKRMEEGLREIARISQEAGLYD